MKEFIQKRWLVEGFYRFDNGTSSWVYECEYRSGQVVWEFGPHTLTCSIDGHIDHTLPYVVTRGDVLVIDFSSLAPHPHSDRYFETYKTMRRGNGLWLYDRKTQTPQDFWLAIKLIPTE